MYDLFTEQAFNRTASRSQFLTAANTCRTRTTARTKTPNATSMSHEGRAAVLACFSYFTHRTIVSQTAFIRNRTLNSDPAEHCSGCVDMASGSPYNVETA
jgi:hypothetical protein